MNGTMEMRLQTRKELVKDYCKRRKRSDSLYGQDLRYHLVFHKTRTIYCFAPKVASTQWKTVLSALNEGNRTFHHASEIKFDRLNAYPLEEVEQMLKTYFTFIFVREPLERFVSAYKDKFLRENVVFHQAIGREIIKKFRPNATEEALATGRGVTFSEFTNYVVKTRHLDEHWRPFDKLCHPCAIQYDFIGHYEDLAEDAPYLLKTAGIDDRVSFPPFRPSRTSTELLVYFSQIPKLKILELAKIYESDYEMFGYRFPGQLNKLPSFIAHK